MMKITQLFRYRRGANTAGRGSRRASLSALATLLQVISLFVSADVFAQVCTTQKFGNRDFNGISGSSDSNIIGVGKNGTIYREDGNGWAAMSSPTNEHLNDVEVVDAVTAFAVGDKGTVLQLVAGVWTDHSGFGKGKKGKKDKKDKKDKKGKGNEHLHGVWAASATEAYAVGRKGTLFSYDGANWTDESGPAGTNNTDLKDAWGDANAFYAMSDRGELYRYDRLTGSWGPRDSQCNFGGGFEDLWGDTLGNIYLVRRDEVYLHDGSSCSIVATASEEVDGIYGSITGGQIYAAGRRGVVLHNDGTGWTETTEGNQDIKDVWVSPTGNAYYAGKKGELTSCTAPAVIADWHLDECTLGIAGSSVTDSGPNGLTGTTAGGLAAENNGQLCAAAAFDGSTSYVSVPDSAETDIDGAISLAVWVRHNASALKSWEAILAKGDSAYRLHLNGGCGIRDTLPGNTSHGISFGLNGGCNSADLNSNVVPVPGVWYHVAATYDRSEMRVYIDGTLVNSANYSRPVNTNNFDLFIGANSQQANRHWDGDIDELTLWHGAISAADVASHMNRTRPCSNCSNVAFRVNHDNSGIHCLAETVRIDVVDGLTGSLRADYSDQVTLVTQTASGSWTLVSGGGTFVDAISDDGIATYIWPLGESSAEFALSYTQGPATVDIDVFQSNDPLISDDDSEGDIVFSASGFTLTAAALSNPPPALITPFTGTQIAGTDFGVYLAAFGQTPNDPVCGVIETYTGPQNLKFWLDHNDPASGTITTTINGSAISTTEASAVNQAVTFINGQAAMTAKYKDAGRIQILVKDDSLVHPDLPTGIRGATIPFVVKPEHFDLSGIEDGVGNANPAAADASGAAFIAAGNPFSVTVTAYDAEGDVTPNYGQESASESVLLTSALVSPAAGNDPGLSPALAFNSFSAGSATGTTFTWPEVGIITLLPTVGDGDYLGGGDVTGTVSGNVGRFIPDHFTTALNAPEFQTQCGAGEFSYIGQYFDYSIDPLITVTARASTNSVTQNYTGSFFKITNLSLLNRTYTAASGTLDLTGLPATSSDPVITDSGGGTGTMLFDSGTGISYLRSVAEAAFDADISLSIDVFDTDGVTTLSSPVSFSDIAFDNGANMRYGRLRFINALGSELVNLNVAMRAEYFVDAATGFVTNTDDSCTDNVNLSLSNFSANLSVAETCVLDSGSPGDSGAGCAAAGPAGLRYREPPLGGNFNLYLLAPGAGNDGSTDVTADVPAWLEFDWDASVPGTQDPVGTATFGIYDGESKRIYTRELY